MAWRPSIVIALALGALDSSGESCVADYVCSVESRDVDEAVIVAIRNEEFQIGTTAFVEMLQVSSSVFKRASRSANQEQAEKTKAETSAKKAVYTRPHPNAPGMHVYRLPRSEDQANYMEANYQIPPEAEYEYYPEADYEYHPEANFVSESESQETARLAEVSASERAQHEGDQKFWPFDSHEVHHHHYNNGGGYGYGQPTHTVVHHHHSPFGTHTQVHHHYGGGGPGGYGDPYGHGGYGGYGGHGGYGGTVVHHHH